MNESAALVGMSIVIIALVIMLFQAAMIAVEICRDSKKPKK